jgi:hypothetical protein
MRTLWLVLATLFVIVLMGAATWYALNFSTGNDLKPVGMKRLSGTLAEGLSYRQSKESFPRISCDACRIGKKKMGVFSLGAFSTIEFDNLVVNIPSGGMLVKREESTNVSDTVQREKNHKDVVQDVVEVFKLESVMSISRKDKRRSFAGIKINRFAINRMGEETLVPIVSVNTLQNRGRRIILNGVSVFREGSEESIASAELILKPRLRIVWDGGFFDLSDMY